MSSSGTRVRSGLRDGDLGAIIAHHGTVYGAEFGLDSSFEAHVAASVDAAGKRGWPGANERVWIVERDRRHAGSLALTDEGDGAAAVRWFVLDPQLRGEGLGRRLVGELLEAARERRYQLLGLETFSELRAAAHIYRSYGFELRWSETGPRWGRDRLTYQRYELELSGAPSEESCHARPQSLSSRSAGSSARPFSVSA